ncbi:MAG: putative monovalent cation/H+ antiporter subunit A [candidate division KSB1 bacterium]|nr:putative monovalent cation/H+ antiporter subunit A [candidate division KSB1 bacterium]
MQVVPNPISTSPPSDKTTFSHNARGRATGWVLALVPFGLVAYFSLFIAPVAAGRIFTFSSPWIPRLGINLSFHLDGLSLLFALLISGIGALVTIYGSGYLAGHPQIKRFYIYLLLFMISMLGLVLSNNLITLFMFWELTSISSYLLIGFSHERTESRSAALQALLITGLGGLALLAGLLLLGFAGSSLEISTLLTRGDHVRQHALYLPILVLVLAGALTKSAQVPFHFWLPGAMEAPAPVSAYLHSATMVKAGVYLLARLNPLLGGTEAWHYIITTFGAVTMLVGALLALPQTDLKRLLAYSTVSALGTLMMLLGLNTSLATKAAVVFLLVHSLYKGALFMIAGAIDHETGTREVDALSGLIKIMPITAVAAGLAALSMSGFPPLLGFISKELLYEAKLQAPTAALLITMAGVLANVINVAVATTVGIRPFVGEKGKTPRKAHEAPLSLWLGPMLMASLGLLLGLFPDLVSKPLIAPAVNAVRAEETVIKLKLWHGVNPVFMLSLATVITGVIVFFIRGFFRRIASQPRFLKKWTPSRLYEHGLNGLLAVARAQTRLLQNGSQRYHLITIFLFATGLILYQLVSYGGLPKSLDFSDIKFYEAALGILILLATLAAIVTTSRLAAAVALGVVGYGIAMIFILFGAPDLAVTQFLVETLMVILFVLVIYHLPPFGKMSPHRSRLRDAVLSLGAGGVLTALVLQAGHLQLSPTISNYFAENSLPLGKGRNIVNVILVDFRSLDTLGEITVLSVAALGVYALLKLRAKK